MTDRRGGGRPPRRPFEGRGEGGGRPPRSGDRDSGPPRRGRPRDDEAPRGRPRDDAPPSGSRFRDDRPPSRDRFRDDRPPARDRYRDDGPPPRDRFRDDERPRSRPPREDAPFRPPREEAPYRPPREEAPYRPPREEAPYRPPREDVPPPPWQREQRPPRPGPRGDVAGPVASPPPVHKPETLAKAAEKITAATLEVHRQLGNGLDAIVYHRALALELQARGMIFGREERIPIVYKERQIETRKVDFLVEGCLVEIVSQPSISKEEMTRYTNYLKASGYQLELLLNFGPAKPDVRHIAVSREVERPAPAVEAPKVAEAEAAGTAEVLPAPPEQTDAPAAEGEPPEEDDLA